MESKNVMVGGFNADLNYARITQINRPNIKFIRYFEVKSMNSGAKWLLIVNQKTLIGIYPTRDAALGALIGCFMYLGAKAFDASGDDLILTTGGAGREVVGPVLAVIERMLGDNSGSIDNASNDLTIPFINISPYDIFVNIRNFSPSDLPIIDGYFGFQVSEEGSTTWLEQEVGDIVTSDIPTNTTTIRKSGSNDLVFCLAEAPTIFTPLVSKNFEFDVTFTLAELENKAIRPVIVSKNKSSYTVVDYGLFYVIDFEPDSINLSVEISSNSIDSTQPIALGDTAHAVTEITGLAPNKSTNYVYTWYREIPTLTSIDVNQLSGGTAPTINTADASATNPTVGDTVSVINVTYSGTEPVTITYDWLVDAVSSGITTSSFDTSSLSGGEALTCTVTATNADGSDSTTVSFGTVEAADYSDAWIVGGGYAIVPHTTSTTGNVALTDAGTSGIAVVAHVSIVGTAGEDGDDTIMSLTENVIPTNEFKYCMRSGSGELAPAYSYMAVSQNSSSVYGGSNADGWVICAREAVVGTNNANFASWMPIDGTTDVTGAGTYNHTNSAYGLGDKWSNDTDASSLVFFMSSYNLGDCHSWSNWDGVSHP